MGIEIYGFDTGKGLPAPTDYRDLPYYFATYDYPMNPEALRRKLTRAKLILGDVRETVPRFCASNAAPLAAVMFDLDLYSSTIAAMQVLEMDTLPRVHLYFDNRVGLQRR